MSKFSAALCLLAVALAIVSASYPQPPRRPTNRPAPSHRPTYRPAPTHRPTYRLAPTHRPTYRPGPTHRPTDRPAPTHRPTYRPAQTHRRTYRPAPTHRRTYRPAPTLPTYRPPVTYKPRTTYRPPVTYRPRTTYQPPVTYRPRTTYRPPVTYKPATIQRPYPSPGHSVIDDCTCFEKGNYYSPVSSDNCASFTQRTAFLPAVTQNCPEGTQFDVKTCVCNYPRDTVCPQYCPQAYVQPATSFRSCSQNGNTYRQVPGTNCYQFTQETATLPPQTHSCPAGLQFDLDTCVCNYPKDTTCYV